MANIKCPMCSRDNIEASDTCLFCGARLTPMLAPSDPNAIRPGDEPVKKPTSEFERSILSANEPMRAGDEPVKKDTGQLEQALPSWLRALRQGQEPSAAGFQEQQPAQEGTGLPDWLAGLDSEKDEEQESVPDWLSGLRPETLPSKEEKGETPDWLGGIPRDTLAVPGPSQPQEETPAEETGADWLSRIGSAASPEPKPSTPPVVPHPGKTLPLEFPKGFEESPVSAQPAMPSSDEGLPAWLLGMESGSVAETEAPSAPPPPERAAEPVDEKIPEWLTGFMAQPLASQSDKEAAPAEEPKPATADVPAWASEISKEEAFTPSTEGAPAAEVEREIPDWLAGLKIETPEEPAAPAAEPAAEIPGWLANLKPESSEPGSQAFIGGTEAILPTPGDAEPDWLSKLQVEDQAAPGTTAEELPPAVEPAAPGQIPDWLAGMGPEISKEAGAPPLAEEEKIPAAEPQAPFSMETPDWLKSLKPEESSPALAGGEGGAAAPGGISQAELPSWVQAMRPVETVVAETKAAEAGDAPVESKGPLAGLSGVLPAGRAMAPSRKPPALSTKLQVNDNQQRHAMQLEKMISGESEHRAVAAPSRLKNMRILRIIIAAVLFLVVAIPVITGYQFPGPLVVQSQFDGLVNVMNSLPPNSPVLVAFDYEPAFASELEAAAAPVFEVLMTKGTRLTIVSTAFNGPTLGERFISSVEGAHQYQAGEQYANLGYIAGGPAGVLAFAGAPTSFGSQAEQQSPAMQGIQSLRNYAAVFIITDNPDTGRIWIEQAGSYLKDGENPVIPMILIVSAQAEPLIQPYYDSGQIQGILTGLAGGMYYEQNLLTPGAGLGARYWSAFSAGMLAAGLIILVGGMWAVLTGWRSRNAGGKGKQ
jgi:hypothetical protein